jgi:hypothetical protein
MIWFILDQQLVSGIGHRPKQISPILEVQSFSIQHFVFVWMQILKHCHDHGISGNSASNYERRTKGRKDRRQR